MTNYTRHETAKYRLTACWPSCFELMRKSDARRAFFQGDDASLWERNMEALEKIETEGKWCAGNSLDQCFDDLCSGYDDVLQNG